MRKILIMILLLFATFGANAQKIHWLLFIDTDDSQVGEIDKYSRVVLKDHFVNTVNSVLAQEGYETPIYDNYGSNISSQNCKSVVSNLQCGSDDIIVFYYIGHGGRNPNEPSQWPMLWCGEPADHPERMVSLEWVHNTLKRKNARLTITIGMCCNSDFHGAPLASSQNRFANYGNTYLNNNAQAVVKRLFLQNRGDILATSASPKESSGVVALNNGNIIDTYTFCFVNNFEESITNGNPSWNSFFSELTQTVTDISNNYSPTHHTPQFRANVSQASQPSRQQRDEPDNVEPNDAVANVLNTIAANFDYVTDANSNSLSVRRNKLNDFAQIFASDAKVKVYSQDGNYQVDVEPIDVYLNRIASSGILMKVAPFDYRASGGRISELKVKEYYKRKN